jgi:hypothetical protein
MTLQFFKQADDGERGPYDRDALKRAVEWGTMGREDESSFVPMAAHPDLRDIARIGVLCGLGFSVLRAMLELSLRP